MSESNQDPVTVAGEAVPPTDRQASETVVTGVSSESRSSWIKLFIQPLLLLAAGAAFLFGIGTAQKLGWISAGGGGDATTHTASAGDANTRYICPMMCTPPQAEPGRCPVCRHGTGSRDFRGRAVGLTFCPDRSSLASRREYSHGHREVHGARSHDPSRRRIEL